MTPVELKRIRDGMGWTQEEAGAKVGVTRNTWARWERGVVEPRLVECGYGAWEGQPLKKLAKDPLWRTVQHHPSAVTFPGGEAMSAMSARAVAAVRDWDARVTATHGPDALWLACSHGDVIKSIVADALGTHLDLFQRIAIDPASLTVIRYTPLRPFLLRANDIGGDLSGLRPPNRRTRRRPSSEAVVGGGAGSPVPTRAGRTNRIGSKA